jgi:ABC-type glutathione transport system ATPase component
MAMMLITHDLGVIAQMAEQVVVMYAGRVVESGPTAEILRHPQHPYTQGLIASRPVPGDDAVACTPFPARCRIWPPCRPAAPLPTAASGPAPLPPESPPLREQRGRPPAFTPYPRGRLHEHESHEYVIEVEGLKKHFPLREGLFGQQTGQLRAVDGVSFRIRQGTIFGLVGESGSGKTTVGRTLLGLYEKSAGSVKYRGELSALRGRCRRYGPKSSWCFRTPTVR